MVFKRAASAFPLNYVHILLRLVGRNYIMRIWYTPKIRYCVLARIGCRRSQVKEPFYWFQLPHLP